MSVPSASSLTSPASEESAIRDRHVLVETGLALSEPVTQERVLSVAAQQVRRAISCDAVAIALDAGDGPRLAFQQGFEMDGQILEEALLLGWQAAMENADRGGFTSRDAAHGKELTVPLRGRRVSGAITVLVGEREWAQRREEMAGALGTVAAQVAVALERARLVERTVRKRRLDAIGDVAAGIAHELRNPLFGISSAAQLLRFRVREDPVVEKNLGRILREVERLNGMVSSLLEYARPSPLRCAPRDPDELWQDVLATQRGLLESKALVLTHRPAHPRVTCDVDAEQLAHVLVNVLVNAADAAPEGSDLTLISEPIPTGGWRCRLQNGGRAIAPDALPRVFDLFFSTKPGAAGIGLTQCQRILEEHGGSVALDSGDAQGTTVTIELPSRGDEENAAHG